MGLSYEEGKKVFLKTILILGVITIGEVLFALLGKGHLIENVEFPAALIGLVMISMSLVKAYLIVYEFMHMKYEVKGLPRSVLLPTLLLVWGIIAFLWDGDHWMDRREKDGNKIEMVPPTNEGETDDTHLHQGLEEGQKDDPRELIEKHDDHH